MIDNDPLRRVGPATQIIRELAAHIWNITEVWANSIWIGSGFRTNSTEHATGRALDIMVSSGVNVAPTPEEFEAGTHVVNWLVRHADDLHITHLIWDRLIWRRRTGKWGPLPNRTKDSSLNDWHEDHIHLWLDDTKGEVPSTPLLGDNMPVAVVTWYGRRYSSVFRDALAEWKRLAEAEGIPFRVTQGGFNGTNVSASAGTHAGDAVDLSVWGLTKTQVSRLITLGRMVGIANWFRTTKVGKWGTRAHGFSSYHIHGVPNGWGFPSRGAANQATSYRNGRDGLASNQVDAGPGHVGSYRTRTWQGYLATRPIGTNPNPSRPTTPPTSGGLTMTDVADIKARLDTILANTATAFGPLGGREYISEHNRTTGNYILTFPVNRGGGKVSLIQEIADTKTNTIALQASVAALTKAVEQLSGGKINMAEVQSASQKGAAAALHTHEAKMSQMLSALEDNIRDAVVEAQGDVDPEHAQGFADAVVDAIKARL